MINARPIPGTADFQRGDPPWYRRFDVTIWQDWTDILFPARVNWSDFTLIQINGEAAWLMGTIELEFALLGFHIRFTYFWPNENREALKRDARLIEAGMLETTELPKE
jgi:hypothetical protein